MNLSNCLAFLFWSTHGNIEINEKVAVFNRRLVYHFSLFDEKVGLHEFVECYPYLLNTPTSRHDVELVF